MATQPAAPAASFDPATWLAAFSAAGGGWAVTPDAVQFAWVADTDEQMLAARTLYAEVEHQADRIALLRQHLERGEL